MLPDAADLTLQFTSTDAGRSAAPVRRRLTAFPEGMGTMMRLSEGSSLRGTVFNLVNTMIGGGILGLPFAMEQMGMLLGMGFLVFNAVLQDVAVWMLLVSVDETREKSFAMVAEVLYDQTLGLLVDVIVTLNNLGVLISYVVIIGDIVPPFMAHVGAPGVLCGRSSLLALVAACVLLPMSSMRNMGALRHTSLVCLVMIGVLLVIVVAMGAGWIDVSEPTDAPAALFSQGAVAVLGQLPVLVFAYNCNMNVPILYGELRRQKHEAIDSKFQTKRSKMMAGMHISVVSCAIIYMCVAVFGYAAFRDRTAHDILTNLEPRSFGPAPYVKAAYSIVIICSYPVMCFSCAASLHRLLLHAASVLRREPGPAGGGRALFSASSPCPSPPHSPRGTNGGPVSSPSPSPPRSPREPCASPDVFASPYKLPGEAYLQRPADGEAARREPRPPPPPPGRVARLAEVAGIVLATLACGVLLPDVSVVFGLTGGLCGGALTYIFPGLFYLRVARKASTSSLQHLRGPWLGHVVLWLGIVVSVGSTAVVAWQTAAGAP